MTVAEFQDTYFYKEDLENICRKYQLPTYGTKAELGNYIISFLRGTPVTQIKPKRKSKRSGNHLKSYQISPKTRLLDSGFSLNNEARKFFKNYFGLDKFSFKKAMAITLRKAEEDQDTSATVQDLIVAYQTGVNVKQTKEEKTYQWNKFVQDFNADPQSKKFNKKMKVAAILWSKVRDSCGPKNYRSELITNYRNEISKYLIGSN